MSDQVTRALVLRQFAALRRQGMGSGQALELLGDGLLEGAVRDDCVLSSRALVGGRGLEDHSDFTRVLTDSTSPPEAAEGLAEAFEARLDAADALAGPTFLLQLVLAGPLVLLSLLGWLFHETFFGLNAVLPSPTRALLALSESLRFVGVPLGVGCIFGVRALRQRFSPGFPGLTRAVRLLEASTRAEAAVDLRSLELLPVESQVLDSLRTHGGFASALRTLAAELIREARGSVAAFRSLGPVVAVFVVVGIYLAVLIALYLPIFSIAGSIK
jgi:hypothetical protein